MIPCRCIRPALLLLHPPFFPSSLLLSTAERDRAVVFTKLLYQCSKEKDTLAKVVMVMT
jgi:hypothetical protein